ncbi:MAG: MarR family winged helix-turn-helix transcriptional regulator [Tepidisphaeraceae bacterium]
MASPISQLDDHLGYWMRFVSNHVSHAFRLKIESRGVTVAEWVVMRALFDQEPANPSQLAERIGLTRGAVSKLVDRLVTKGLIACQPDPHDRRYQSLTLSAKARKLLPVLARLADENDALFFGTLSASDRNTLQRLLQEIVKQHNLKAMPLE